MILTTLALPDHAKASPSNCFGLNEGCFTKRSSPVVGSTGSRLQVNPSSVPIEDGFGLEGIYYKNDVDLLLVRGNGRIGAAISPANSESTFFGPPAIELPENYLSRRINATKYPSQKLTVATAASLIENPGRFSLHLGVMGRYNKETYSILPGGGLSGSMGPLAFSYSLYNDETRLDYQELYGPAAGPDVTVRYKVQTYGVGLYLSSLILDYSRLQLKTADNDEVSTVDLLTASLIIQRLTLTASYRSENSADPAYNYQTKMLETQPIKKEYFGGVQFTVSKNIVLGALYNYYLLHEYSAALTLFF